MQSINIYLIKVHANFCSYCAAKTLPLASKHSFKMPPTQTKYVTKLSVKKIHTSNTMNLTNTIDKHLYN